MEGNILVDVAWCVSRQNFVQIAQDQLKHAMNPGAVVAPYEAIAERKKRARAEVHAKLVDSEGRTALAKDILMEAQAPGLVNGEKVWHTLIGGVNKCSHCSRLDLDDVPAYTHRILVHVILSAALPEALLYLSRSVI